MQTAPRSIPGSNIRFAHLSLDQGLSQSVVNTSVQDSQGYMWFGTQDGLNRFDGYSFTVYKHDPENPVSLSQNWVTALFEDSTDTLWIGTFGGGLDRLDNQRLQFSHYRNNPNDPSSLSNNYINSIYEDSTGVLWIGTAAGVNQFDRRTQRFTNFQKNPYAPEVLSQGNITTILENKSGILWLGTDSGLVKYERSAGRFVLYENNPDDPKSLSDNQVLAIYEDRTGALWVGTDSGGISVLNYASNQFDHFQANPADPAGLSDNQVNVIYEDRAGALWIGTEGGGLATFDRESRRFVRYVNEPDDPESLSGNYVRSLYENSADVLWIGTWGAGLDRFDRRNEQFVHYRNHSQDPASLASNLVWAFCEDPPGVVWIGTENGLDRLDEPSGRFTHYRNDPKDAGSLISNQVEAIHKDRFGALWVGTAGGLDRFDRENGRFIHYRSDPDNPSSLSSNKVASLFEDPSGTLWVGTANGLNKFDRETGKFTRYYNIPGDSSSLSHNSVWSIAGARDGALWIGTAFGLNRFDPITGRSFRYLQSSTDWNSLSENGVLAVYPDSSGNIWIGTMTGGLNRFDTKSGIFTHYREKQGMPNDTVYGILEDDVGFLWLSTNKGLSKFDPRKKTFKNYDVSDGLQSNEFHIGAFHKGSGGELYFGGVNGMTVLNPQAIRENSFVPPIALTQITQGGQAIQSSQVTESQSQFTLSWPNNYFEFEFAALSYAQPQKNQYAYRLDDFDRDWNQIGTNHFGRYTNLPGGTYTLRLKGSNSDGVWNEQGTAVQLTVVPPYWETWWFRGLFVLLLAVGAAGGYWLRVRDIRARNRTLEIEVDERTWALGQRTRELEEQQQELQALYLADEELHHHLHLDDVLQALVNITVDLLKADKSALLCWDDEHERLVMRVARGFSRESMAKLSFARGEGFAGHVAATGQYVIIQDMLAQSLPATEPPSARQAVLAEGLRSLMHLPIKIKGEVFGIFNVSYTQFHVFSEKEQRLFTALAQRAALAIEGARHLDAEERRAEQFRVINEVGHDITSILNVDQLLKEIVQAIQTAFGYYAVGVALVEGDELVIKATAPRWQALETSPLRLKVKKEGVLGWVAGSGEPLLIPDVSKEPRFLAWPDVVQTRSELAVPLKTKSGVIGVLNVESDRLNAFDDSDLMVLESLAIQAAVAIENARLYERAQELAVMQERNRLARELHDAVTQTLFSASLLADALPSSWESDPNEGRQLLKELRQLSRGALAEMRTLLLELRPAALVESNLGDLLRQLGEATAGRGGLVVTVNIAGDCRLPPDTHIALYRIAQEALNNVVKHSRATHVVMGLNCISPVDETDHAQSQVIALSVSDDGRGFDPNDIPANHLGLGIMRERAQSVGATLTIETQPGRGTQLRVVWEKNVREETR